MKLYRIIIIVLLAFNSNLISQTIYVEDMIIPAGDDSILVPVKVSATLNKVKSISMQFSYDEDNVTFDHSATAIKSGIANFALGDIDDYNIFISNTNGIITLSWFTSNTSGNNFPTGKIFDLDFDYISGFSEVRLVSTTIKTMDGKKVSLTLQHGSIAPNTDPAIKVYYPNGGETIEVVGAPTNITWTSVYTTNVKLEYTTDNGTNWNTIIDNYPAIEDKYSWTVPSTINSTNCKIKISDAAPSGTASDLSDNIFIINSTPILTITTPNGGEELQVGGIKKIAWTFKNVENIKIEYCTNSSAPSPTWQVIAASIPSANNYYDWTIPNSVSADCKIKISKASDAAVFDLSDAVFIIYNNPVNVTIDKVVEAKVEVIGKEIGNKYRFFKENDGGWKTENLCETEDGVEYCAEDELILYGKVPVRVGWLTSIKYLEMFINYDPNILVPVSLIPAIDAFENISFSYDNGVIHIIWGGSDPIDIHGKVFDLKFRYVNFNDPTEWITHWDLDPGEVEPTSDPNGDQYPTATIDPRNFSDIEIEDFIAKNSANQIISFSGNDGSLAINSDPAIKILSPINGSTLEVNDVTHNILWASKLVNNVLINYSIDDGSSWNSITSSTPASSGTFSWTLPNVNANNCKLRIEDITNSAIYDITSSTYAITNLKTISLTSPDGGEILKTGTKKNITWLSRNINKVKLEYTTNNLTPTWKLIADNVNAKDYSYEWLIPTENSNTCDLKITDVSDPNKSDQSSTLFTINNSKTKIKISDINAPAGNVTIPVTSERVNGATYFQLSIKYDPVVMQLNDILPASSLGEGMFHYTVQDGIIRIIWFSTTALDFSGTIFNMHFTGYTGAVSVISFDSPNQVKDAFNKVMDIEFVNGGVGTLVTNQINIPEGISPQAGEKAIPVNFQEVYGVTYFQLAIKYDPLIMELKSVEESPMIATDFSAFNSVESNNTINVTWSSSVPMDLTGDIFNMYFAKKTDDPTTIIFDSTCQVRDASNDLINIQFVNGSIGNEPTEVVDKKLPLKFDLSQNYPNPFNPVTTIRYEIPKETHVLISIYNVLGEKVITLVDDIIKPGFYNALWNANNYASGIYYYSIVTNEFSQTKKMILLK